jgi:hypothetical protein
MRWVLTQPESVLSVNDAFVEVDQVHYSLGHTRYVADPWQGNLVKKDMNAVLENIVRALNSELQVAFDARFGTDENDWKEIDLLDTVRMVVAQAASRFTVGMPLCMLNPREKNSLSCSDTCSQAATSSISETALTPSTAASSTPVSPVAPLPCCVLLSAELSG